MIEKVYHIYAKDTCIYHSLSQSEFNVTWESLNNLVEVFTEYQREDLTFEEVVNNRQELAEASY
jgi:hypothetical protein